MDEIFDTKIKTIKHKKNVQNSENENNSKKTIDKHYDNDFLKTYFSKNTKNK